MAILFCQYHWNHINGISEIGKILLHVISAGTIVSTHKFLGYPALTYLLELATGGKSSHPPYAEIEKRQSTFLEAKYLPPQTNIRQPRNLTKAVIQEIFEHLTRRQEINGPELAFRFKQVKIGNQVVAARYPETACRSQTELHQKGKETNHRVSRTTKEARAEERSRTRPGNQTTDADRRVAGNADAHQHATHDHYSPGRTRKDTNCNDSTYVLVNDGVARRLRESGMLMPVPYNGPTDGPPMYAIPCHVYRLFAEECEEDNQGVGKLGGWNPVIDPLLQGEEISSHMPTENRPPTPNLRRTATKTLIARNTQIVDKTVLNTCAIPVTHSATTPSPMPTPSPTPTPMTLRSRKTQEHKEKIASQTARTLNARTTKRRRH